MHNLVSLLGIVVLMGVAWLLSADRRNLNWRLIAWGVGLQLLFALFIFVVPAGSQVFLFINKVVVKVLDSSSAGAKFLFGRLAVPPGEEGSMGFFLAFQALPTIIFFASLISVLYFFKIMPLLIRGFSYVFTKLMRLSGAESLCAASNIFVGIESALTIKPYLSGMTPSELCTILTAGMATVASNVLALYVFTLKSQFPTIAGHLVSASILSAPAALVMSKLILPEAGRPVTLGKVVRPYYERDSNVFEAVINGALAGVKMIVGIAALLIAVLGLVSLVDFILGGIGGRLNSFLGIHFDCSLKGLLGYLFYPFTVIIGVPLSDAGLIASIIGERVVVTEVVAYQDLATALADHALHHPRSTVVATYALCGFAHLASMAIFVGGIAALVPGRVRDLSRLGFRALIAATLACLMTGAVAGVFLGSGPTILSP